MANCEQVLGIGPYNIGVEDLQRIIETFEPDGHVLLGFVNSLASAQKLIEEKDKPTVVFVQDFPYLETTQYVVKHLKELFPEVVVATFGADQMVEGADYQFGVLASSEEVKDFLFNLQH